MAVTYPQSPSWARSHPRMMAVVNGIMAVLRYLLFFRWVVDIARWLINTGGNVAESAFLLATVYVTINTVAHLLVAWVRPPNVILTLNQVSVIAFSVLPELIIFAAIKTTFDHFKLAAATKRIDAWAWAIAYVLPTSVFLYLTIATISSFVSVEAVSASAPQATGAMLVTRCLAGWSYGMLQMLFVKIGHEGYSNLFERLHAEIAALGEALNTRDALNATLHAEVVTLKEQAIERRAAWKEITHAEETEGQSERSTDEGEVVSIEESTEEIARKARGKECIPGAKPERHLGLSEEANMVALQYENALSWLTASGSTVSLKTASETMNVSMKLLRNRVESKKIRATKNKEIVYKESVIEWAIAELISRGSSKIVHLRAVRNEEDTGAESSG